jgi:hypothetical protein
MESEMSQAAAQVSAAVTLNLTSSGARQVRAPGFVSGCQGSPLVPFERFVRQNEVFCGGDFSIGFVCRLRTVLLTLPLVEQCQEHCLLVREILF